MHFCILYVDPIAIQLHPSNYSKVYSAITYVYLTISEMIDNQLAKHCKLKESLQFQFCVCLFKLLVLNYEHKLSCLNSYGIVNPGHTYNLFVFEPHKGAYVSGFKVLWYKCTIIHVCLILTGENNDDSEAISNASVNKIQRAGLYAVENRYLHESVTLAYGTDHPAQIGYRNTVDDKGENTGENSDESEAESNTSVIQRADSDTENNDDSEAESNAGVIQRANSDTVGNQYLHESVTLAYGTDHPAQIRYRNTVDDTGENTGENNDDSEAESNASVIQKADLDTVGNRYLHETVMLAYRTDHPAQIPYRIKVDDNNMATVAVIDSGIDSHCEETFENPNHSTVF